MRYLVISDIHSNLEALEAVLADAPDYDAVLCLGDLVGYGPNPNECVKRVRELPNLTCLVGNHDLVVLGKEDIGMFNDMAAEAAEWTKQVLDAGARKLLERLKPSRDEAGYSLFHASPRDPVWEYLLYPDQGPPNFQRFTTPFALIGHSHVALSFEEKGKRESRVEPHTDGETVDLSDGRRRILNPGGAGQPRDLDPRAAYALLDLDKAAFTYRRVDYPIPETQRKILAAGLPKFLADRLAYGR